MVIEVRRLEVSDVKAYKSIRLEALQHHPEAFQATYERSAKLSLDAFAQRLERYRLFGGFMDGELMAMVGLYPLANPRIAHKSILWGLYVREGARRHHLGRKVVEAALEHAKGTCKQVLLSVITENTVAISFFDSMGFERYGLEPRALKIDGKYYDEEFRVRSLD